MITHVSYMWDFVRLFLTIFHTKYLVFKLKLNQLQGGWEDCQRLIEHVELTITVQPLVNSL